MWVRPISQAADSHPGSLFALHAVSLLDSMAAKDAEAFPRAVIRLLAPALAVAHSAVFSFRPGRAPVLECEASASDAAALPSEVAIVYAQDGHYRSDALAQFIEHQGGRRHGALHALRQSRDDIVDARYRRHCYQRCQVIDRLSVVIPIVEDRSAAPTWLSLNLYRTHGAVPFSEQEVAQAQGILSVAAAAVRLRHLLGAGELAKPADTAGPPMLSRREAQVADLLVMGLSSREIAARLGIRPSTVTTLRRRAYEKLGVANGKALAARWAGR